MPSVRSSTSDLPLVADQQLTVTVAAAVGRVLDINPLLLRPDTPLDQLGCDNVALLAIADALAESGTLIEPTRAAELGRVTTFGDLVDVCAVGDE